MGLPWGGGIFRSGINRIAAGRYKVCCCLFYFPDSKISEYEFNNTRIYPPLLDLSPRGWGTLDRQLRKWPKGTCDVTVTPALIYNPDLPLGLLCFQIYIKCAMEHWMYAFHVAKSTVSVSPMLSVLTNEHMFSAEMKHSGYIFIDRYPDCVRWLFMFCS